MATYSAYITASSDDARQSGSTMDLTGGYPNTNSSNVWVGFRFLNVDIPQGSTINSAYINLNVLAADDPDVDIYGNDVDDAATFTTTSNDISSRALTTAKVNWTASNIGTYSRKDSPDIKTIIQEIVDRAGWSSGNAIAILFDSLSSSYVNYKAYDSGEGATQYARLTIEYTSTQDVAESVTIAAKRGADWVGLAGGVAGLVVGRGLAAGMPGAAMGTGDETTISRLLTVTGGERVGAQEIADILRALGFSSTALAGGAASLPLGMNKGAGGAATAGATDGAAILRALTVTGDGTAGATDAVLFAALRDMVATGGLSLAEAITLAIGYSATVQDGFTVLEAMTLGRALTAG